MLVDCRREYLKIGLKVFSEVQTGLMELSDLLDPNDRVGRKDYSTVRMAERLSATLSIRLGRGIPVIDIWSRCILECC